MLSSLQTNYDATFGDDVKSSSDVTEAFSSERAENLWRSWSLILLRP